MLLNPPISFLRECWAVTRLTISMQHTHLGRSANGARRQRRPQRIPGCEARLELPRHCEAGWGRRRGTFKVGLLLKCVAQKAFHACATTAGSLDSPVLSRG